MGVCEASTGFGAKVESKKCSHDIEILPSESDIFSNGRFDPNPPCRDNSQGFRDSP